jgi:hypothetical protein
MACNLGPDFLCSSITNLRGAEDGITALIIAIIIYLLIDLGYNTIKQGPFKQRLIVLAASFLPFLVWKLFGAIRRIFLEKTSALYEPLNNFGEVMEGISALCIIVALVYMYVMLKPTKVID